MRFNKNDRIKHDGKRWQCIISDEKLAVFGRIIGCCRTSYKDIFIVANNITGDGFKYETISKSPEKCEVK